MNDRGEKSLLSIGSDVMWHMFLYALASFCSLCQEVSFHGSTKSHSKQAQHYYIPMQNRIEAAIGGRIIIMVTVRYQVTAFWELVDGT